MQGPARCRDLVLRFRCNSLSPTFNSPSKFCSVQSPVIRQYRCLFATEASPDEERVTDEVLREFLTTIENEPASGEEVYNAYIDRMCKAGNLSTVSQMLQILHDKNIFFTPNLYNLLLLEASRKNDIDLSCEVFTKLLWSCKSVSATPCLNFAQAFTKVSDCVELLRLVKKVSELTSPSTSVINRIIIAFAKSGQKDKALLIFDHLKEQNFNLDLITYNIVLDILGHMGRLAEMIDVFASMKEAGFAPDIVSYNTLINSLRKVGRSDICLVYFKEMGENGIEPDLLTYTALIESFGRSGNVEESLKCFKEMKMKEIRPSLYIYRSLINNLNKAGKVEVATELLEELNSSLTCLAVPDDFKQKRKKRNT